VLGGLACAALRSGCRCRPGRHGDGLHRGRVAGALWIMLAGWLRQWRGINETISSLLLAYIAIGLFKHLVEGPLRDPASLNKPSTYALAEAAHRRHRRLRRALGPGDRRGGLRRLGCGCAGRLGLLGARGRRQPRTAQLVACRPRG
jgi:hypothetical protein